MYGQNNGYGFRDPVIEQALQWAQQQQQAQSLPLLSSQAGGQQSGMTNYLADTQRRALASPPQVKPSDSVAAQQTPAQSPPSGGTFEQWQAQRQATAQQASDERAAWRSQNTGWNQGQANALDYLAKLQRQKQQQQERQKQSAVAQQQAQRRAGLSSVRGHTVWDMTAEGIRKTR